MNQRLRELQKIKNILELNNNNFQLFVNRCQILKHFFKGDGCGLKLGGLIEDLFVESLNLTKYNIGQADFLIGDVPFSFKKTNGGVLAINWSKNPNEKDTIINRDILILNLKTQYWYKTKEVLYSGLYIIDKNSKILNNIKFEKNNKSNTVITKFNLYNILLDCVKSDLFIRLPEPHNVNDLTEEYSLIKGFYKKIK